MEVGIVGGSIAGCTAAVELLRAGHQVTVFERSTGPLRGRGAGIGTPTGTLQRLVERDLVDADMPRFVVSGHPLGGRRDDAEPLGHTALTLPLDMALLNWGDLYGQLRRRVPEECYRPGAAATDVRAGEGGRVVLCLGSGREHVVDLVLFADGYRSLGRRLLFPGSDLSYRGYVLWRGVLEERELEEAAPLEASLHRLHYKGLPGNAVFYFVPGRRGSVAPGSRWVNWAAYLPVPADDLTDFLVDREGRRHEMSIPPGLMRPEEERRLKELMAAHLPSYFADIVGRSHNTFAQPIYTVVVPGYARDRCALLGDAGSVAPPFTGSGVFKAVANAVDLVDALAHGRPIDQTLAAWSEVQAGTGRRLASLGEQMEQAFVWDAPDLSQMDQEAARDWWTRAVTFPDDFSYVRETEPTDPD